MRPTPPTESILRVHMSSALRHPTLAGPAHGAERRGRPQAAGHERRWCGRGVRRLAGPSGRRVARPPFRGSLGSRSAEGRRNGTRVSATGGGRPAQPRAAVPHTDPQMRHRFCDPQWCCARGCHARAELGRVSPQQEPDRTYRTHGTRRSSPSCRSHRSHRWPSPTRPLARGLGEGGRRGLRPRSFTGPQRLRRPGGARGARLDRFDSSLYPRVQCGPALGAGQCLRGPKG